MAFKIAFCQKIDHPQHASRDTIIELLRIGQPLFCGRCGDDIEVRFEGPVFHVVCDCQHPSDSVGVLRIGGGKLLLDFVITGSDFDVFSQIPTEDNPFQIKLLEVLRKAGLI